MTEKLCRAFPSDLEIRGGSDGRTLVGLAAPFDSPAEIGSPDYGGFVEQIERGAFARTIAERGPERVRLLAMHADRSLPIGKATSLREDAQGLVGEFRVSKTSAGDDVLELVRDGSLDGLSIGFQVIRERWASDRSQRNLLEVRLHEVSVVNFPAYDSARVLALRSSQAPSLSLAYERLELLRKVSTP